MSADNKLALTILEDKAKHLGVDLLQLARAVSGLDDRTIFQSIVKDLQNRQKFQYCNFEG